MVFPGALLAAIGLMFFAGGHGMMQFDRAGECSPGQLAEYQALSFYDDFVQPPEGKYNGNYQFSDTTCVVSAYVIDQPTKQAWATMDELLMQNGWEKDAAWAGRHCFRKGDFRLGMSRYVSGESLPVAGLPPGSTVFRLIMDSAP